ncbi:efflux RND transporter permease subunit [Wenzhouxiangella sediminis]|uniref:Multidrug efflux protein n=1 Tax=Wenzhouxiangella sediminis TaxID=1792836 RepID=A0A3E1KA11_9GAMM|nr:efflux RND transporter permease subunit [Wenzhouxiangella sediminis]RFF31085.1 multidrug efflux protein [Wenzhouxiangella sediminis]
MKFTDIFITKPVLATVVSLFILLLGLRAAGDLNVRQYPELQNAVISVSTAYIGADADLVQGFITTPMEREVATAEGIDYIVSTTVPGASNIQAYLDIETDPNEALTQVAAKVNKLRGELPDAAEDPIVDLAEGQSTAAMYLSFYSELLDNNQITDYLVRVVEPKLSTIPGVQRAQILGAETFAMRIWLDPARMTSLEVTASDVYAALASNNVLSAVGSTKGQMISIGLTAETDLQTAEQFQDLVVKSTQDTVVRLEDIAQVELGSESYNSSVSFNGEEATFIGVQVSPDANSLDVIADVREVWDNEILPELPTGLEADIPYDSTEYINNAIDEVITTIIEALIIVVIVIFLFLGSLRTVIIPAVAVPLSLIGAMFLMLLMGFSINLLTLLAMVLAIGIVVDDAIIVLENIHRHIEEGMTPKDAAIKGARELAWPVVAMTTTLVAVYIPIGFIGGLTGTLFVEFAFTLAGAVLLSGLVALTLSPMMCAKLLKANDGENGDSRLAHWLDERFDSLRRAYRRRLHGALETKSVIAVFGLIVLVSCGFLFVSAQSELAPEEDQGFVIAQSTSDPYSTIEYLERYTRSYVDLIDEIPELENVFIINGASGGGGGMTESTNSAITGFVLKPWNQRERGTREVMTEAIQPAAQNVAGLDVATFMPPALPSGGSGFPVEFVIGSTEPLSNIQELSEQVMQAARESGKFIFVNSDLNIDKPRVRIQVDRDKAALLGVDMATLGNDLSAMLAGGYVNRFAMDNRSYRVVPQVAREWRLNPEQLENYYTRSRSGELIPLSTLVSLEDTVEPRQLKRFQQLNAVTISGVPRPGVPLGDALAVLDEAAAEVLPPGYNVDYAGQSRQFKTEGSALLLTFAFALTVIFLVLSAQFESFRDPLIMLVTVPMSICGAMIFVSLGLTTLNIYTQVGLVTLIGVISKHGILIVEFANKLQEEGMSKRKAIEEATSIRLRPILMTTAALVLAMVPLLIATGAGAASRFSMGLVIATGMTIGTAFTLFVVPAMYLYLARDHGHSDEAVA